MVGTREKAEPEQHLDSDSDVPDQVTLSSGREEAQKLRKEERENRKRVQAEAKQRRHRSAARKKEAMSEGQQDAPVADTSEKTSVEAAQNETELQFSKPGKISGFLDSSLIDFLSTQEHDEAKERNVGEISTSLPADENPRLRNRTAKRKRTKEVTSSGRVKIMLLESNFSSSANHQNALEFKQKRLYGDRSRSLNMLLKPRAV